jgi:hypothetical protein
LSVNGTIRENYLFNDLPTVWDPDTQKPPYYHIYIRAMGTPNYNELRVEFFDQRKKQNDGNGLFAGKIKLLTSNTLQWTLDEKEGLWWAYEGDDTRDAPDPVGFSVPINVVITRETSTTSCSNKTCSNMMGQ